MYICTDILIYVCMYICLYLPAAREELSAPSPKTRSPSVLLCQVVLEPVVLLQLSVFPFLGASCDRDPSLPTFA